MRDKACCPFLDLTVTTADDQVWWDCTVVAGVDNQIARGILADLYTMPDTVADGVAGIVDRLGARGVAMTTNASGTVMQIHHVEEDTRSGSG